MDRKASTVVWAPLLAIASSSFAADQGEPGRHWSGLPLLGEEAAKRGIALPPPFGVSLMYTYVERDITVDEVRISAPGQAPAVLTNYVTFAADSKVDVVLGRIDTWLLPFLNLYLLAGRIDNQSRTDISFTVDDLFPNTPGNQPVSGATTVHTRIEGFVGGGGLTVAGGYGDFFLTVDGNWTQSDMGFDDEFIAIVGSARMGWQGGNYDLALRLYAGGSYWDTANTAKSTVNLNGQELVYEADQRPEHPTNLLAGCSYSPASWLDLVGEYGFNFDDVRIVTLGVAGRF